MFFRTLFTLNMLALLAGCSSVDIEDCSPGFNFKYSIAGTWDTPSLNASTDEGEVTFNSNGIGSTTQSSIFDNGSLNFSWSYSEEDETLTIGDETYQVIEVTCIEASFITGEMTFTITR